MIYKTFMHSQHIMGVFMNPIFRGVKLHLYVFEKSLNNLNSCFQKYLLCYDTYLPTNVQSFEREGYDMTNIKNRVWLPPEGYTCTQIIHISVHTNMCTCCIFTFIPVHTCTTAYLIWFVNHINMLACYIWSGITLHLINDVLFNAQSVWVMTEYPVCLTGLLLSYCRSIRGPHACCYCVCLSYRVHRPPFSQSVYFSSLSLLQPCGSSWTPWWPHHGLRRGAKPKAGGREGCEECLTQVSTGWTETARTEISLSIKLGI